MSDTVLVPSLGMALMGSVPVTPETAPHWAAAHRGVLSVPTCDDCATRRWPTTPACYRCGSLRWSWQPVPGTGRVYTYTWLDAPIHPSDELRNVVVVQLDAASGPEPVRVPGWVTGVDKATLRCDLPVEVAFEPVAEDVAVPYWRPR